MFVSNFAVALDEAIREYEGYRAFATAAEQKIALAEQEKALAKQKITRIEREKKLAEEKIALAEEKIALAEQDKALEIAANALREGASLEFTHRISGIDLETLRCMNDDLYRDV